MINPTYEESFKTADFPEEPGAPWLRPLRESAFARFQALGFPNRRLEDWKYINLIPVLRGRFEEAGESGIFFTPLHEKTGWVVDNLGVILSEAKNLRSFALESGASPIQGLRMTMARGLASESNPFAAINTFRFRAGAFIFIPKDYSAPEPIELFFRGTGTEENPKVFYPRVLVVLEDGARAKVVFHHAAQGAAHYFMNAVSEIHLGRNAGLDWIDAEERSPASFQFHSVRAYLQEESRFQAVGVTNDGAKVRREMRIEFEGQGGFASVDGLSVLDGDSQVFDHVTVNHRVPECTSRQTFKNILSGNSQTEFDSLSHVFSVASKSDTYQLNKNLLLSENCRAYSRPQLKIYTDDVKANHGAANGRMERDELFYLQSRGLSKPAARFILTYGFAKEILDKIGPEPVRRKIDEAVRAKIERMIQEILAGEKAGAWTVV